VELYYPAAGRFLEFGNLQVARDYHTATTLPNGTVLIAGGEAPDGNGGYTALASAELFNPLSLTSVLTGNLNAARLGAVSTLLGNGTVLISGGESTGDSGRVPLASAEIFDPAAGTFTTTGPLEVARASQTATLLPNGSTLIVGGFSSSSAAGSNNSAEIYEPATLTPAGVSQMLVHALTYPLGSPLAISPSSFLNFLAVQDLGGKIAFGPVNWSSSDATVVPITNDSTNPGVAVALSSPTAAQNITITATIGSLSATGTLTLNPPAFVPAGNMTETRYLHTSTRLLSGDVLLVNGDSSGGAARPAEIYSAALGSFQATGTPSIQRTFFTATLLPNGKVLIAGGTPANVTGLASAELYDPDTSSFAPTGSMSQGRYSHTATLLQNGKVLIAGGQTSDSDFLSSAEIYDPASGTFSPASSLNIARGEASATRLADGRVLIAGGQTTGGSFVAAAEIFDPAAGTFTKTGNLGTPRVAHAATLLSNGSVLIAGGDADQTYASTSAEIFSPVNGTFAPTGDLIVGRSYFSDTLLINGKVLIAGGIALNGATSEAELYDPSTGTFAATTSLTSLRTQHAATRLENGAVLITGGTNSKTAVSSAEIY
jgi:Galactose oxidase, central domain